jgi:hypothetical protein
MPMMRIILRRFELAIAIEKELRLLSQPPRLS